MGVWLLLLLLGSVGARRDGAPRSACHSLTPRHGSQPRSPAPYALTVRTINGKVAVSISSSQEEFEGFVLQARSSVDKDRIVDGKFTASDGITRTLDCSKGKENTLTHSNAKPKRQVETEWVPKHREKEDVIFRATVAKNYEEFWTEIDSGPVTEIARGTPYKKEAGPASPSYSSCFSSRGCFGLPSGCVPLANCEVLLAFAKTDAGVALQLAGFLEPQTYMAVALSNDQSMGDDFVTECFREDSVVTLRDSWNDGGSNTPIRELPRTSYTSGVSDGLTTCEWTWNYLLEARGKRFDLLSTYYLLLAKGPTNNRGLRYHSTRLASQQRVNLTSFEAVEGGGISNAVKVHGALMVTAWLGLVSVAVLLARHFKAAWGTRTCCGVNLWFALHRAFMILALLLVVIAFVVIFIYKNGWNYETTNPHAILGCIATVLGLLQPLLAAFRPVVDHPKRPVFNWLHWGVGNAAHICAVVAVFFAVSLEPSGLKDSFYWVVTIFVIVYLIFHFLFQLQTWTSGKKINNEVKMHDMISGRTANNLQNNLQENNLSADVVRMLLLSVYLLFLVALLLTLYALIGAA